MLAALDLREHFDNYFLHTRHELTRTQIGNAQQRLASIL